MALAVLSIDLEARLARLEQDLGKASRLFDKLGADARGSLAGVGEVFAGVGLSRAVEESLRTLVTLFPSLIDGVAVFQDLAEETGASAAGLASFQTAADVSGVTVETLAGLTVKLTGNLAKLTDEGKGAGAALKALGIPLAEFRALSPDEQIKRLAAEFDKFADGSSKTAVALGLFGKSGAQVLKFFNEYTNGAGESNRLTAEMIAQADTWADAQARASSELRQTAQVIAVQALPALTAIKQGFADGAAEILGFKGATAQLDPKLILDFAEAGSIAMATLAEALVGVGKAAMALGGSFQSVGADIKFLGAAAAVANPLAPGTFEQRVAEMRGALDNRNKVAEAANQRYLDLWNYNGTAISDSLRKSFAEQRRLLDPESQREANRLRELSATSKPVLPGFTLPDQKDTKRDDAFARFMAQITKQDELAQAQIDTGGKLADSDRKRIELLNDLTDASKGFSLAQQVEGESAAEALVQKLKRIEIDQQVLKNNASARAAEDGAAAATGREIDALIAGNEALRDQVEEIGLTVDAVERLRVARVEHRQELAAEEVVRLRNLNASVGEIGAAERVVELLRQQIELRGRATDASKKIDEDPAGGAQKAIDEYLAALEKKGKAAYELTRQTQQLFEDDLANSLRTGKLDVSRTVDFIISEALRLTVIKPIIGSLFSSIGGSGIASLFGFANGGAFGASAPVPFARGDVFDSPTLFKFASGGALANGVLGEAEPEAILPLKRGAGGRLGVVAQGGGGVVINQYLTVGGGVSRNEFAAALEHNKRATIAAVADARRRGRETV